MKKIGIVTLFGLSNYGNRLQNYAVQEILKKYGYESSTIVSVEYQWKIWLKFWIKTILRREWKHFRFARFNRKYLNFYKVKNRPLLFPKELAKEFDYFIVGSDQVWNPDIRQNQRDNFFLSFANEKQRLTISPSIAVQRIPDEWVECFRKGLSGFRTISVREESSKQLVESLVDKEVEVLTDPTMMLTRMDWEKLETKVHGLPSKYVVKMFLGSINENIKSIVDSWANEHNYDIVDFSRAPWCYMGPDQFLTIIHKSNMVFTDSFHATVFSIIFNRPFYVCNRESIDINDVNTRSFSRIETLIDKFGFSAKILKTDSIISITDYDFNSSNMRLDNERKKFDTFMKGQLGILK